MSETNYSLQIRPMPSETVSGDTAIIKEDEQSLFIALIDIAGHGNEAHVVANESKKFVEEHYQENLILLMASLHQYIKGKRGCVAAFCRIHLASYELHYVGIGNITTRIIGKNDYRLIPTEGMLGQIMPNLHEQIVTLNKNDLLLLHSDGITNNVDFNNQHTLRNDDVKTIVTTIINKFAIPEDDASCIAVRI